MRVLTYLTARKLHSGSDPAGAVGILHRPSEQSKEPLVLGSVAVLMAQTSAEDPPATLCTRRSRRGLGSWIAWIVWSRRRVVCSAEVAFLHEVCNRMHATGRGGMLPGQCQTSTTSAGDAAQVRFKIQVATMLPMHAVAVTLTGGRDGAVMRDLRLAINYM